MSKRVSPRRPGSPRPALASPSEPVANAMWDIDGVGYWPGIYVPRRRSVWQRCRGFRSNFVFFWRWRSSF